MSDEAASHADLLALTAEIVSSHVANNRIAAGELPALIQSVHGALAGLDGFVAEAAAAPEHAPAVSVRKSVASPDFILSLIDGRPYKALKRHLANHGLTPAAYRERYGLKADYPMVAPAYAETRRMLAKTIGLGRKAGRKVIDAAVAVEERVEDAASSGLSARRGRKPKALGTAIEAAKDHLAG